ncbi:hypothetical protein D3C87_77170 [compost metagenome]
MYKAEIANHEIFFDSDNFFIKEKIETLYVTAKMLDYNVRFIYNEYREVGLSHGFGKITANPFLRLYIETKIKTVNIILHLDEKNKFKELDASLNYRNNKYRNRNFFNIIDLPELPGSRNKLYMEFFDLAIDHIITK